MFSNGRARSGIIVLPCGAGKTLTGITAATTVRKSAMVLTSSSVAVDQWKRSFTDFTTVDASRVISLTSEKKHVGGRLSARIVIVIAFLSSLYFANRICLLVLSFYVQLIQ